MGWIPVSKTQSRSSLQTVKKHWEYGNTPMTRLFGGRESKYQTDMIFVGLGILLGGLFGALAIHLGGVPLSLIHI